jgi:hypothetical protein
MRERRLLGSLVLVIASACTSESVDRSREVVDEKLEKVDEKLEVARDRLADAVPEIERNGREGLRQAGEGLDRWLEEGREQLGTGDDYTPIAGADQAIDCPSEDRCTIDAGFIDRLAEDPLVLSKEAVALPTQGTSERGLGLSRVRPGSIPDELGLRDGDVLISLNGTNLASLAAPRALADALSDTNEAKLVYERAGQRRTLTIVRTTKP